MKNTLLLPVLLLVVLFALPLSRARAQSLMRPTTSSKRSRPWITQLFDAYNHCDLATFSSMIAEDVEFYHD
jgi:hypothetical protein